MKLTNQIDRQITTRIAIELTGEDIVALLQQSDQLPQIFKDKTTLGHQINFSVKMRGGRGEFGDAVDVNEEDPISVVMEIVEKVTELGR